MHPGNSGLSGGAFSYDKHVTSIKKERQEEVKKKEKKKEKTDVFPAYYFI